MRTYSLRPLAAAAVFAIGGLALVGCTTSKPEQRATASTERSSINAQIDATLSRLYSNVPGSRDMVANAKGVLVFPSVVGGSFVIGAEYGHGALRVNGGTHSYYNIAAGSVGWQVGAQSKAIIYLFMNQDALEKFRNSKGWTAGVDATVAVASMGANGTIDTNTVKQPVVGFVLANAGLEIGASLQGMKITPEAR